ncbi:MAG: class I SAM-dependent methyltransferase [Thermodesulfobacteriota bacterium]
MSAAPVVPARDDLVCGPFSGQAEEVACPLCQPAPPPVLVFRKANGVGIWRCPGCDILYASPRFTEASLLAIYESPAFFAAGYVERLAGWSYETWPRREPQEYHIARLKVNLVRQHLGPGARILDVGCHIGLFCREAQEQGLAAEGLEPSRMLADLAGRTTGVTVHNQLLEDFAPATPYQGLVVWDVLEHVYDPLRLLAHCHRLTGPDGYLFLQVPSHRGLADRYKTLLCRLGLKRCDFKHFGFPWHVYSFSPASLRRLLARAGYQAILVESWSHHMKEGRTGPLARLAAAFVRRRCWTDYIVAVGQRG